MANPSQKNRLEEVFRNVLTRTWELGKALPVALESTGPASPSPSSESDLSPGKKSSLLDAWKWYDDFRMHEAVQRLCYFDLLKHSHGPYCYIVDISSTVHLRARGTVAVPSSVMEAVTYWSYCISCQLLKQKADLERVWRVSHICRRETRCHSSLMVLLISAIFREWNFIKALSSAEW